MMQLSICIPTYNFGEFIGETLDSILPQISPQVEVIILDGGSTDDTAELVRVRQKNYPQLGYFYQDYRGGIDRDIEKVVSLAQGGYCWLFSADDIMLNNSVEIVLEAIKSDHDVYLGEHVLCDFQLKPICEYPPFNNVDQVKIFDLGDPEEKIEYFRAARTSEAFFSFLAGPIFKKDVWDNARVPDSLRGSCWIVAAHLLNQIPTGITVNYLNKALLHKREGNDSFSNGSLVHRCRIGIEYFQRVANSVFGSQSHEAFHIRRVLKHDISLRTLLSAKLRAVDYPEKESIEILRKIVGMHYVDPGISNLIKSAAFKLAHPSLLKTAILLMQILRKMQR